LTTLSSFCRFLLNSTTLSNPTKSTGFSVTNFPSESPGHLLYFVPSEQSMLYTIDLFDFSDDPTPVDSVTYQRCVGALIWLLHHGLYAQPEPSTFGIRLTDPTKSTGFSVTNFPSAVTLPSLSTLSPEVASCPSRSAWMLLSRHQPGPDHKDLSQSHPFRVQRILDRR